MSTETREVNNGNGNNNSDSGVTWWITMPGAVKGTDVPFNLSPMFSGATAEQVLKILQTQEVHISCYNKVAVKLRGEKENGSHYIFGHINNFDHGLELDCDAKDASEKCYEIKAMLESLTINDLSTSMTTAEAEDILANL